MGYIISFFGGNVKSIWGDLIFFTNWGGVVVSHAAELSPLCCFHIRCSDGSRTVCLLCAYIDLFGDWDVFCGGVNVRTYQTVCARTAGHLEIGNSRGAIAVQHG